MKKIISLLSLNLTLMLLANCTGTHKLGLQEGEFCDPSSDSGEEITQQEGELIEVGQDQLRLGRREDILYTREVHNCVCIVRIFNNGTQLLGHYGKYRDQHDVDEWPDIVNQKTEEALNAGADTYQTYWLTFPPASARGDIFEDLTALEGLRAEEDLYLRENGHENGHVVFVYDNDVRRVVDILGNKYQAESEDEDAKRAAFENFSQDFCENKFSYSVGENWWASKGFQNGNNNHEEGCQCDPCTIL